ncbi:MAG: class I SAM-dependent methyltransferase [Thermodesulfobacteriota bacterium]
MTGPSLLLLNFVHLLQNSAPDGPVLDLACGNGNNGLFLAELGLPVILADRSRKALPEAEKTAKAKGLTVYGDAGSKATYSHSILDLLHFHLFSYRYK